MIYKLYLKICLFTLLMRENDTGLTILMEGILHSRQAMVSIPKLSIETSYSLRNILSEMGMSNIFSYSANFTGIANEPILVSEVSM